MATVDILMPCHMSGNCPDPILFPSTGQFGLFSTAAFYHAAKPLHAATRIDGLSDFPSDGKGKPRRLFDSVTMHVDDAHCFNPESREYRDYPSVDQLIDWDRNGASRTIF